MTSARERKGKRPNGEGSYYQRKDGRWVGAFQMADGKRKSVYGATYEEARDKVRAMLRDQERGWT